MFGLWYPHSLIRLPNPVFEYDMRRLRQPRNREELKGYSRWLVIAVCGIVGAWWLAARSGSPRYTYSSTEANMLLLLGFLTLCLMLVSNFYYALLTVGTINREITSTQWDQLRLTALDGRRILFAKYAILQIRAWRLMMLDIALRAAAIGLVFVAFVYNLTASPGSSSVLLGYPEGWSFIAAMIMIGATYILEPLWRMRAVVSIGMAVSVTVRSFTYAFLATLGFVVLVYLAQMLIWLGFGYFVVQIFAGSSTSSAGLICCIPLVGVAIFCGYYGFYRTLCDWALEHAFKVGLGGQNLRSYVHEESRS